ncbi:hypothetical protein A2482_02265 [Candidatus Falkowbacteria bacterium RIFOXYC2_FULL_48_21]|uniref:Uncharacterized protein n=1 Tax=Candidatus Falkowbacteria bacterium RIFOXYC2_FULL_48_21 TaxID=1798005 RepID=A0A1F5TG30_9BACT|nr:MAG: hypothetical protein A2482_02265 [Candidatus Falkowbacteria bacterium RIFOXYC2_FULL_48_21]
MIQCELENAGEMIVDNFKGEEMKSKSIDRRWWCLCLLTVVLYLLVEVACVNGLYNLWAPPPIKLVFLSWFSYFSHCFFRIVMSLCFVMFMVPIPIGLFSTIRLLKKLPD